MVKIKRILFKKQEDGKIECVEDGMEVPRVELVAYSKPDNVALPNVLSTRGFITFIARVCTGTQDLVEDITEKLAKNGHFSPFEFVWFCIHVRGISRVVSHQIVRHRLFSFMQKSQRFCKFRSEVPVILPESMIDRKTLETVKGSVETYFRLLEDGVPPQDTRYVLPECVETELYIAGNLRQWAHYIRLRDAENVQPEHRVLAGKIRCLVEDIVGRGILKGLIDSGV